MGQLRKVYLPRWIAWLGLATLLPMWLWITYRVFVASAPSDPGVPGWVLMTVILAAFAVLLVLLARRKLPVYLIEVGDDESGGS